MDKRTPYELAISCDGSFVRLFDETHDDKRYHTRIENEWGRFTAWGRNLGAFQEPNAKS
jgi:hypothetical protein